MGRILRIELENFKSYFGRQIVGPFKNFTCIVGPNGAGKSNLMDAISFVMGVQALHLRSANLRELVYNADGRAESLRRRGAVMLVYAEDDGTERRFERVITGSGTSEYRINGAVQSRESYEETLRSLGVHTKARNFLVFQGDVESIAAKSPRDLTTLLEQVAGSDEFRKQYEEKRAAKEQAAKEVVEVFQRKKGMTTEKKQYAMQKREVERFRKLAEEERDLRVEYTLFRLYHTEREIRAHKADISRLERSISDQQSQRETAETQLRAKGKECARARKQAMVAAEALKKAQVRLHRSTPTLERVRVEEEHARRTLERAQKEVAEKERQRAEHAQEVERLSAMLEECRESRERFEAQVKDSAVEEVQLEAEQLQRYRQIKEQAGAQTVTQRQELEQLRARMGRERAVLEGLIQRRTQLVEQQTEAERAVEGLGRRQEKLQAVVEETQRELEKVQDNVELVRRQRAERGERRRQLEERVVEARDRLLEIRLSRRESEREARMKEAVESMKRLFSGVHGRMSSLVKVTQRRYATAVGVAMGRNSDAIVVEERRTALECLRYLREQRIGTAQVIPLDTVQPKVINERLRRQGGTAKLVYDVLSFEPGVEKAVRYAVGSTVVCESLDEARRLAYQSGEERSKVVTLDGTLIHKSGLMTGGRDTKASRWEEQDVERLKQSRDRMVEELAELQAAERAVEDRESDTGEQRGKALANRIRYSKKDLQLTEERQHSKKDALETIKEQLGALDQPLQEARSRVEEVSAKIQQVEEEIALREDELFADFSREVGVESIREYEATRVRQSEEHSRRRAELETQEARLRNSYEYETRRDFTTALERVHDTITASEQRLEELGHRRTEVESEVEERRAAEREARDQSEAARAEVESLESEKRELKRALASVLQEVGRLKKRIAAKESMAAQLRHTRQQTYLAAKVEEVEIPRIRSRGRRGHGRGRRRREEEEEEEVEEMDIDSEGQSEGVFESSERFSITQSSSMPSLDSSERTETEIETEEEIAIDFRELPRTKRETPSTQREDVDREYREQLAELSREMESLAPNLRSINKLEEAKRRYEATSSELDDAREASETAATAFEQVHGQRRERFMETFQHVHENIDPIYKELTRSHRQDRKSVV